MYFLSGHLTRSYPGVTIELFICCLLGPICLWAVLPAWSLIFSGPPVQAKNEVSSLALEHIIKPGELRVLIRLLQIGNHRSSASVRTKLIDFIFDRIVVSSSYLASLFTDCHEVGNVFNIKRSPYGFNFCLVYAGILLIDYTCATSSYSASFTSCSDWLWLSSFSIEW
jgi:hypothetical protein